LKFGQRQTLSLDDFEQLLLLVQADDTIASLEPFERDFKIKHKLFSSTEPVTLRSLLDEMHDEKEQEGLSDIFYELDAARMCRTNILGYFSALFNIRPRIPVLGQPQAGFQNDAPFDASRTWAVIIGVDKYEDSPLNNAVHDSLCFKDYLALRKVDPNHISLLLNDGGEYGAQPATRQGILEALHNLRDNEEINDGDTIIIMYAGHGVAYSKRDYWPGTRGRIEALAPVNRGGQSGVPDISDRELNLFLADLARSKGNNITVILDCCYAAGATRQFRDEVSGMTAHAVRRIRRTEQLGEDGLKRMLEAAESYGRKRWQPGLALSHPNDWRINSSSHVVIASCKDTEQAYEDATGGVFTSAFLRVLWNDSLTAMTYEQLVEVGGHLGHIGAVGYQQSPVVAGRNVDCLIFRIPTRRGM